MDLPLFDLACITRAANVLVVGPVGKTTIAQKILAKVEMSKGVIMNDDYDPHVIDAVLAEQKESVKQTIKDPHAYIVLDDCIAGWPEEQSGVRCMFFNNRALKLMVMMTMAYPMKLSPAIRWNTDYVFILREKSASRRRLLWEQYSEGLATYEEFCEMMDSLDEYWCIVIDVHHGRLYNYEAKNSRNKMS